MTDTGNGHSRSASTVRAGVVGVGSMGRHHARVYGELQQADLVGVADADAECAAETAAAYGTDVVDTESLLEAVDVVSVAVPTRYHHEVATAALDHGVDVLVEKPIAKDFETAKALRDRAAASDAILQVGHVERFNPAVRAVQEILADLDVIAIDARRLGPPVDRDSTDSAVMDLMIHDLDLVSTFVDEPIRRVAASGACDRQFASAQLRFDGGTVCSLQASRVTQQKIRDLSITAHSCRVHVDYADQQVEIHRHSVPEYIESDGDVRYRHESIIEQPTVDKGEPLKAELAAFVDAATGEAEPVVTAQDGVQALELAREIDALAASQDSPVRTGVTSL